MSAYTQGRPTPVFHFTSPHSDAAWETQTEVPTPVLGQLEGVISAARQLEQALKAERQRYRALQESFRRTCSELEARCREGDAQINEISADKSRLEAALTQQRKREQLLLEKGRAIHKELLHVRAELKKYQTAWAGVLQREREAREILAESRSNARRREELEKLAQRSDQELQQERDARKQAERHAESYQKELQSTLIRLHSAESKFSELSREYQAMLQSRRRADEEIAKIEHSLRERLEWETAQERERIRAEMERHAAIEREEFREETRLKLREEIVESTEAERKRLEREAESLRIEAATYREALYQERQDSELRISQARAEAREAARAEAQVEAEEEYCGRIRELESRIESLQGESARSRAAVAAANEALTARVTEVNAASEARAQAEQKVTELQDEVSQAQARLMLERGRKEAAEAALAQARENAAREREELERRHEEVLREIRDRHELALREAQDEAATQRREAESQAVREYEESLAKLEARLNGELKEARERAIAFEAALTLSTRKIEELEALAMTRLDGDTIPIVVAEPADSLYS